MKRRTRRRGRGITAWAKKGLKSTRVLSRGANFLYNKYGSKAISKIKNPMARMIAARAVKHGINQIKQRGYGRGGALRLAGNGRRRRGCCRR